MMSVIPQYWLTPSINTVILESAFNEDNGSIRGQEPTETNILEILMYINNW